MESQPITKDIVVLYHGNCADGFCAAWVAWKKFGDRAEYIPAHYEMPFPRTVKDKDVYLVDFTGGPAEMRWLLENNRSVTVIDHHKTKEEDSKISTNRLFDMSHSGAALAWQFFHPNLSMPVLVNYVEDSDLWKHSLPDWNPIRRYISAVPVTFEKWQEMAEDFEKEEERRIIVKKGNLLAQFENNIYNELEAMAQLVSFEGHEVYAVNAPHWFASGLAYRLYSNKPPFAIVWHENAHLIHVSLRSNGSIDVSAIAKKYAVDGGGHFASAAFKLKHGTPLPWTRVSDKNHAE